MLPKSMIGPTKTVNPPNRNPTNSMFVLDDSVHVYRPSVFGRLGFTGPNSTETDPCSGLVKIIIVRDRITTQKRMNLNPNFFHYINTC
ncbi:hypothetical protein GLYMA_17G123000v4 [Glycine max]|uniref:Uncharacterized protein n=2 Tax=Glycine subgen. Soja TaxID=1462606 RepID=K7MLB7_SOYBN|nr:hypothetical protein GYH30_047061 [Glycine max]KRH03835.1 hypothetical protein GLYMA_17G123000v4 [Glycine max]RZB56561.1 hypothetical protein D0Y65_045622 [Glycine soja]